MATLLASRPIKDSELRIASEEFGDYVKLVVDVEKEIVAAGGQLHSDGERLLLDRECRQEDLWGGGLDLVSSQFDCLALINIRPQQNNPSQEILDPKVRKKFLEVLGSYFPHYGL